MYFIVIYCIAKPYTCSMHSGGWAPCLVELHGLIMMPVDTLNLHEARCLTISSRSLITSLLSRPKITHPQEPRSTQPALSLVTPG